MARTIKDTALESRAARSRLKARPEPYWRAIDPGAHLGYYKSQRGGFWRARLFEGGRYHKEALGLADDLSDADGVAILSFTQAQAAGRAYFERKRRELAGLEPAATGPYTVTNALNDYLVTFRRTGKGIQTAESFIEAHIRPALGSTEAARLTPAKIEDWKLAVSEKPRQARAADDAKERNYLAPAKTSDEKRARRATANRVLTILKAALNRAWEAGKIPTDSAWRKVKPFKSVDAPVIRYLTEAECLRLVNACPADFRSLVTAALLTGCRYSELTALVASDFDSDAGSIVVRESKSGKPRHVTLTTEGQKFFATATAGSASDALIFTRDDGAKWGKSYQQRPLVAACKTAKIAPAISFHILRHSYASILARKGVPMPIIAQQLGHADDRMTQRHYAHLSPSHVADTIRASFPNLGINKQTNVVTVNAKKNSRN